jgi:DNA-directed RNA polymerase specialized sigma24 family protein
MQNSFIINYKLGDFLDLSFTNSLEIYLLEQIIDALGGNDESAYSEQKIYLALESMDDYFKASFKMHIVGYKCDEIAKNLNLNLCSVKCRIYYTWKRILESMSLT